MKPLPSGPPRAEPAATMQLVLLVDDEEDIRESLKALFETCLDAVRVETAASGDEALDVLARETVALVVTDYKMPGMNGLELLAQVARTAPDVPRILVTAFPDLDIALHAINEAAVDNFFTKPFEPDEVLSAVRTQLYERRAQAARVQALSRAAGEARRGGSV